MKYTIDDLRGKYVKVGTPECDVFLDVCDTLGIRWADGASARNKHQDKECIALSHHTEFLSFSDLRYYRYTHGWSIFVPKTTNVDWSKAFEGATHALVTCPNWVSENSYACEINFAKFKNGNYIGEDGDRYSVGGGRWKVIEVRPTSHGDVDDVDDTVTQRGERYGLFADGAIIMQDLKAVMRATSGWERLTPSQREALEMIQHKIGRVLNGDPMYDDSWRDIAGYSTLILNELNGVKR